MKRKGLALVVVWGVTIVMCILALGVIYLAKNHAYIAEHKIKRMAGFYTVRSGMMHALNDFRDGPDLDTTHIEVPQSMGNLTAQMAQNSTSFPVRFNITVDYGP